MGERQEGEIFELQVRHIAACLWPRGGVGNPELHDGRERDGVFITDDDIHIVEATVSRQKQKVSDDCGKTLALMSTLRKRYPDKIVRGWLVTKHQPTPEQVKAVSDQAPSCIRILSYDAFCRKLVDVRTYLHIRMKHYFGSARNPADVQDFQQIGPYIPVSFEVVESGPGDPAYLDLAALLERVRRGKRVILTGDYGSGKSMALRELFIRLKNLYEQDHLDMFPIYINLREHWGQTDPSEVLERHGRIVGYPEPSQLIRAWKAGLALLLLDGFDELAAEGWSGNKNRVREIRRKATAVVKSLVRHTPKPLGLAIAGRSQYFDNRDEMLESLGLSHDALHLIVGDFTAEQIRLYLENIGHPTGVPSWLPSRPLLLGYLASRRYLAGLPDNVQCSPGQGWHSLIAMICEREADLPQAEITADELRDVLARIATIARGTDDGLGPLQASDLFRAYEQIMEIEPGDAARPLLLRLPGLAGASAGDAGSRKFVDRDFVQAAAAFDIFRFIRSHDLNQAELQRIRVPLEPPGSEVVAEELGKRRLDHKYVTGAARIAAAHPNIHVVALDCFRVAKQLDCLDLCPDAIIEGIELPKIDLEEDQDLLRRLAFHTCIVHEIEIPDELEKPETPRFRACDFGLVLGRTGPADLPSGWFDTKCSFEQFTQIDPNTASIMRSRLPPSVKALLTVLKKLFRQRGAGRREGAFVRGLDAECRRFIKDVLLIVKNEGLAEPMLQNRTKVWVPIRSAQQRALKILEAPSQSEDPVIVKARELK